MNGSQIERYLKIFCGNVFMGVFPSDKLPRFIPRPALFVCNTDASHLPGQHWIAIFVDSDGRGEFMDSFGREPGEPFSALCLNNVDFGHLLIDNFKV